MQEYWIILDLNPEPWAIGPLGVKRAAGKLIPYVGPNKQMQAFQNAAREQLQEWKSMLERFELTDHQEFELDFWIWRRIEQYRTGKRSARKNKADATNIQKALEDSIQGVLIDNDRSVRRISTHVVEQGFDAPSRVVMRLRGYQDFNPDDIPNDVWAQIDKQPTLFDERRTEIVERVEDVL